MSLVIAVALSACDKDKTAQDYIRQAQALRAAGNIPAAIIDLKNALQKDPKSLAARILLAQSYLDLSQGAAAEQELERAKQEGAAPRTIALPLAEAALAQGQPQKALTEAEPPANASEALKASLLSVKAQAEMTLGQMNEAGDALAKGLHTDPHSIDVLSTMVRYAIARKDFPTARARLAEAQQAAPNDLELIFLQGSVEFTSGDAKAAEKTYRNLLAKQGWNLRVRLALAQTQIAANELDDALANLAVVLKAAPQNPTANYFAALASYRKMDYAAAQRYDQQVLRSANNFGPALLLAGAISYALKDYAAANAYLAPYVHEHPQNLMARKMLSAVELALGSPADAMKTLSADADNSKTDPQLLALQAVAATRGGDLASADRYLSMAVARQPDNAALQTQLGANEVALGETDQGISDLQKAAREAPDSVAPSVALVQAYLHNKQYDKALAVAEQLEKARPDDPTGYDLEGVVNIAKGDVTAGRAALLTARKLRPGDPMALLNLATLAFKEGAFDQAEKYDQEILNVNPKISAGYLSLADIQVRTGKLSEAETTLQKAIQQNLDDVDARVALGRVLFVEHKNQDALTSVAPAIAKNPHDPRLLEIAGRAHLALGQTDQAIATFKDLVAAAPEASASYRELTGAYMAAHDFDAALGAAQNAVRVGPKDEDAKKILIAVLIEKKNYDQARKLVAELATEYPHDVAVPEMDGLIALAQGRNDDAIAAYRRALTIHDNDADHTRLAQAQLKAGHNADAENTLKTEIAAHPDDVASRMALGDLYSSSTRYADAKAQYAAVVHQAPTNIVAENNLAWTLVLLNEPGQALPYARNAAAAAPNSPQVLDTLGVVLMRNNQFNDALTTLRKAGEKGPDNPAIQFHLAQALVGVGKKDEARDALRMLLDNGPAFREKSEAQKLLNQLGG